jgi:hypothetical protein
LHSAQSTSTNFIQAAQLAIGEGFTSESFMTTKRHSSNMAVRSATQSPSVRSRNLADPRYFHLSWMVTCLFMGFASFVLYAVFFKLALPDAICVGVLVTFTLLCGALAYKLVEQRPQLIFTPMPWLLLASGAYFGFGPLMYYFGDDEAKAYCQAVYPVTVQDVLRVTLLNALGVALVFGVWRWRIKKITFATPKPVSQEAMATAIMMFYLIGLPPSCLTLLSGWGLVSFTVPSFLNWLAMFTSAGLVCLTVVALRRGGGWWLLLGAMLAFDVAAAMASFSKFAILLAVLPCIFGYLLYRPGVRSLGWILVFLLVVYLASNSYVTYCRNHGLDLPDDTVTGRISLAKSFFTADQESEGKKAEQIQNWWTRLNYANAQAFAMQQYNEGSPGNSFSLAWIAPIPRILWPNKPIIESGADFYKKLTGGETASFGIGFFAEGYWNGGWVYVILGSIVIGWIFGTITLLIVKEQAAGNLWILPIALLWIRSGGQVAGWINAEIVGPAVFTFLLVILMRFL